MRPFVCLLGMLALLLLAVVMPTPAMAHEFPDQLAVHQHDGMPLADQLVLPDGGGGTTYVNWEGPVQKSDTYCLKSEKHCENSDKCRRHWLHKPGKHVKHDSVALRLLRGKCRGGCSRGSCC